MGWEVVPRDILQWPSQQKTYLEKSLDMGGRNCSVDTFTPIILRTRVWIQTMEFPTLNDLSLGESEEGELKDKT